jgi:aromatic-amino-acid transaminase
MYGDAEGRCSVLKVVSEAETAVAAELAAGKTNKAYFPIAGRPENNRLMARLVFGPEVGDDVASVQSAGGTGALFLAMATFAEVTEKPVIFIPDVTWGNHKGLVRRAGATFETYPWYDASSGTLAMDGLLAAIEGMPADALLMLHACCHNPTGVDPTKEQWQAVLDVVKRRGITVLFDAAYLGFASGNVDEDAYAIRLFGNAGVPIFVAQSCSKNFTLYQDRIGCLHAHFKGAPAQAAEWRGQVAAVVRTTISNPPALGSLIVAHILSDPAREAAWRAEVQGMRDRITSMRTKLVEALVAAGAPSPYKTWDHIVNQIGMFSYTGLSADHAARLEKDHGIFILASGRISVAALTDANVEPVAKAIAAVLA